MTTQLGLSKIHVSEPEGFMDDIPKGLEEFRAWINQPEDPNKTAIVAKALHKTGFKISKAEQAIWGQLSFNGSLGKFSKSVSVP